MTNSYARDGFTYGFDFARPRSRAERIARLDALATLLDTAFILPGTNVRFGFDALIGLLPGIGDAMAGAGRGVLGTIARRDGLSETDQVEKVPATSRPRYSSFFGCICCCCCMLERGSICRSLNSRCAAS